MKTITQMIALMFVLCFSALTMHAFVPPSSGNALNFDGINDYVSIQHSPSLAIGSNPVSVECWFNAPNANQVGMIVTKRQPVSPFNQMSIYINNGTNQFNPQPGK